MKRAIWLGLGAASLLSLGATAHWSRTQLWNDAFGMREAQAARRVNVTSRSRMIGGLDVGEVLVNDKVVFRIRTGAGGFTAPQRAETVADRLAGMVNEGHLSADDIHQGMMNGQRVLLAGDELLITADSYHAQINGTSPLRLASMWEGNIVQALGGDAIASNPNGGSRGGGYGGASYEDVTPELRNKFVPILSAGNGVRLGMAQVTGPERDVDDVKAVAELETQWKKAARARLYVPISDLNVTRGIHRVPRVGVSALADIRLKF